MNASLAEQNRNKITAITLLRHLEVKSRRTSATTPLPGGDTDQLYYQHLKDLSTVNHIKDLLSSLDEDDHDDEGSWASTSRAYNPPLNSLPDLRKRLGALESNLASSAPTRKSKSTPAAQSAVDLLRPAAPTLIIPPPPAPVPTPDTDESEGLGEQESERVNEGEDDFSKEILSEAASVFSTVPQASPKLTPPPLPSSSSSGLLPLDSPTSSRSALLSLPSSSTLRSRPTAARSSSSNSTSEDPLSTSTSSNNLLDHHLSIQNSLLSSLTSMSSQLKQNSTAFSASLQRDKEVMEEAEKKLEKNFEGMKDQSGRLKGYGKKQKGGTCWMILGVGVVAVAWTGVFLLIKVT